MTSPSTATELAKGQNAELPGTTITLAVEVPVAADLSALLVTDSVKVRTDADLIFYNQPSGPGVTILGEHASRIEIDTAQIPTDIDEVRLIITLIDDAQQFGQFSAPVATLSDGTGTPVFRYTIDGLTTESVVIAMDLYRRQGAWKVRAVGQGYGAGFASLISDHGVKLADEPAPAPVPVPAPERSAAPTAAPVAPAATPPPPPAPAPTASRTSSQSGGFVNFYEILPGVVETSNAETIKKAIREQRQIWNKRAAQADPVKREQAQKRVRDLGEAERVLLDANKKRAFDQQARQYRPDEHSAAQTGAGGRDWLVVAREYFDRGNFASAKYAAREAITHNGANHEAWSIRANSSFNMNDFTDAGFEFREAISLKPDSAEYHFDYGDAYAQLGSLREARGEYEAALRIEPGNPLYRTAVASIQVKQGESDAALAVMEDVVKEYPTESFFQYYLALAIEQVQLKKWARLKNGNRIITSQAQIDITRQMSGRALALKFDDAPLRASLQENLELADKAEKVIWMRSANQGVYVTALVIGLIAIAAHGLGLIIVIPTIILYVVRHHIPAWKRNAKLPLADRGI